MGTAVSGVTTDQRGLPMDSPKPDIGAFQSQPGLVVNTTIDGTGSPLGDLSLRQAVNLANQLSPAPAITFDPNIFAKSQTITLSSGSLVLSNPNTSAHATETVTGPNAGVTISGGGKNGVFQVHGGVTATLSGLTITDGSASAGGGLDNNGTLTLTDCTVTGNSAVEGGGLANFAGMSLTDCTIAGNSVSEYGGGLDNIGTLTLTDCTVSGNSTADSGGGLENFGTLTLTACSVSGNSADFGGGLGNNSIMTLTECVVSGNSVSEYGGGLDNNGTLTLTDCTVSGNSTADSGGGLENLGTLTLTACSVSGNSAAYGGGLGNSGTMTLTECVVSGNSVTNYGGGLNNGGGSSTLTGCTVSGNSAAMSGGGIENRSTLKATNCTVSLNIASSGGGIDIISGGATTLANTIIALNNGADFHGSVTTDLGYNLIGNTSGGTGFTGPHDVLNVANPRLGALGNYGGPTETIALTPGSPAIDAGSNALAVDPSGNPLKTDQRGALRGPAGLNAGADVDIGAYEASSSYLVTSAADSNDVGTLRTAVGWANLSTNANPENIGTPAPNTIVFDTSGVFSTPRTIALNSDLGTIV